MALVETVTRLAERYGTATVSMMQARNAKKRRTDNIDVVIKEECLVNEKTNVVLDHVNKRLAALGWGKISLKTFYDRRRKIHE